jgi:multiple sugar transport system ATP-binding protein
VQIDVVEELGADAYLYGTTADRHTLIARVDGRRPPQPGHTVHLAPRAAHTHVFSRRDGLRLTA